MSAQRFQNLLVAIHDSDRSAKALDWALSLCSVSNAQLTILAIAAQPAVCPAPLPGADPNGFLPRVLLDADRAAKRRGVNARIELLPEQSAQVLIEYAVAHNHDLIVLEHHGHFLREVLRPQMTTPPAAHQSCPVIVIG